MNSTARIVDKKCRKHLASQGITNKKQLQQRLQEIFEQVDHQNSALVRIYKMFFPDWDRIKQVEGFPVIGREMWKYICNLFIEFDRQHHPDIFKGGLWFDRGFSSSDRIAPWEINFDKCKVIYS